MCNVGGGVPRLNEVAVGLKVKVELCDTDLFSGRIYSRPNWQATDKFFGRFYSHRSRCTDGLHIPPLVPPSNDIDATEFPITVHAATQVYGHLSQRSSCAQYHTQFRTFNFQVVPADTTSHTTTRRRSCRSRRTSFSSIVLPTENQRDVHEGWLYTSKERHNYEAVEDNIFTLSPTRCNSACEKRVTDQASTSRSKRAGENQSSEQHGVIRANDSSHQRRARAALISEQRARERALDAARRKLAREMQTPEQRARARALNNARRKLAREMQTSEQRAVLRAKDSARQKRARVALTSEQRARERARETARRKLAREMQTTDQRARERALDTARRKLAREIKKCS